MDFSLNDIQQMMQDSASKFIEKEYEFETRRKLADSELGYSQENWELFAELGWLALPVDEEYGGIGGTIIDTIFLQNELGKGLVVEPYFSSILLGANLINKMGLKEQKQEIIEEVITGQKKIALAHAEGHSAFDITNIKTTASMKDETYTLNGQKAVVLNAQTADILLVVARTSANNNSQEGLTVFLVDPKAPGVSIQGYPTNDGMRAADVKFNNVTLSKENILGTPDTAFDSVDIVLHEAIIALSAEAVGIMEKLIDTTGEYLRVRQQFEAPIGKFQALQHRAADMFIEKEQSKSTLYYAAIEMANDSEDKNKACKMLKTKIGQSGRFVGQQAVQLHGGMGVTDELDVGHYFKRLTCINNLLGSRDYHLNELVKTSQA